MVKRCGPLHPPSNVGTKCVGPDVKSQEMQSGAFISHGWGLHQLAFAAPSGLPSSSLTMSTFGNIGMWGRRGRGFYFALTGYTSTRLFVRQWVAAGGAPRAMMSQRGVVVVGVCVVVCLCV